MLEAYPHAGPLTQTYYWGVSILRSLARRLVKRVRRDKSVVADEYHSGHWARILKDKTWAKHSDPRRFLSGQDRTPIVARVGDAYIPVPRHVYYEERIAGLGKFIDRYLGNETQLVELGCGTGYNLLSLALSHPHLKLEGYDISPNGLEAANQMLTHFQVRSRVTLGEVDLTNPTHPNLEAIRGKVVFTFFCLEQIPHSIDLVIQAILAHGPKRVINVEPGLSLLKWSNIRDWPNIFYVRSVDYQTRLFDTLDQLRQEQKIRIVEKCRLPFAPTIQNDGLCVIWEPFPADQPPGQ